MDSTSSTLQYPLVCSERDCALCAWDCVNFVSGTVNYVSRTLHCVRGTVNFVRTHDEYMYQTANVLSTLESCVSCFSKLQSVPVCLSESGYIFATNFTAWFYHEFFVCSRKYFYCAKFPIDIKTIPLHFKQTAPSSVLFAWFYQRTTVEMFLPTPCIRGMKQFCVFFPLFCCYTLNYRIDNHEMLNTC